MTETDSNQPRRTTLAVWLASGLGVALVTPAPGTFGALWGLPLAYAYQLLPGPIWPWIAALVVIAVGVPVCARAAVDLGMKDPGPVVWDEFATVPLVFLFVPLTGVWIPIVGFALHRLFDITKPWPCNRLEQLPGGWGIMLDDVAAGFYAAASLWLVDWLVGLVA